MSNRYVRFISWEKPKKARTAEEHNDLHSSDSGVDGTFVPNMSDEDLYRWKGKLVKLRTPKGDPAAYQVELRKSIRGTQIVVIVATNGYRYKNLKPEQTRDINVHVSLNGGLQLTDEEWDEFKAVVDEAKEKIAEALEGNGGNGGN